MRIANENLNRDKQKSNKMVNKGLTEIITPDDIPVQHKQQKINDRYKLRQNLAMKKLDNAIFECDGCGDLIRLRYYHVDHIKPKSRGGSEKAENLALLCGPCNLQKGARTWAEWKGKPFPFR